MEKNILENATFEIVKSSIPDCVECLISYETKDGIQHGSLFIEKKPKWGKKDYINYAKSHYNLKAVKAKKSFKVPFIITLAVFGAFVIGIIVFGLGGGGGSPLVEYHDVVLDYNDGSASEVHTLSVRHNQILTEPKITYPGHTLSEWQYVAGGTGNFDFSSRINKDGIKIEALWDDIKTYNVHFYDDDGNEYQNFKQTDIEYGHRASRPKDDPTKENCYFGGWFSDTIRENPFDFTLPLTGEITEVNVYAKFNPIVCRVTFNPNGGTITGVDYVEVNQGDTIPSNKKPPVISPTDMGEPTWYTNTELTNEFKFDDPSTTGNEGTKVTGSMTLYAGYKITPGSNFEDDSWAVLLNEIEDKSFEDIKSSYGEDTFVGLSRSVDILNDDGTITQKTVVVIDENENAQADDDKFTFLITINDEKTTKFNTADDNNNYLDASIRHEVDNYTYRIQSDLLKRISTVTQTCADPLGGDSRTIDTKLFVPSASQVYGIEASPAAEGSQFDIFTTTTGAGMFDDTWLRTPYVGSAGFAYYGNGNTPTYDTVTSGHKLCAAFVIK